MKKETVLSYVEEIINNSPVPPRKSSFKKIFVLSSCSYSGRRMILVSSIFLIAGFLIFLSPLDKKPNLADIDYLAGLFIFMGLFISLAIIGGPYRVHRALQIGLVAKAKKGKKKGQSSGNTEFMDDYSDDSPVTTEWELLDSPDSFPIKIDTSFLLIHPTKKNIILNYGTLWELS